MQADAIVDLQEFLLGDSQGLPVPLVPLVGEGDDRVDPVIAAVELDDDEHAPVLRGRSGPGRPGEEAGDGRREGQQGRASQDLQGVAAGGHRRGSGFADNEKP